jgi:uncharacterized integral membrane protein
MRLIRLLIALACLAAGLAIGALNHQPVMIDLGFNSLHATLGVSLLVALLLGALVGGLAVTASVVLPLQQRLRRMRNTAGNPADDGR